MDDNQTNEQEQLESTETIEEAVEASTNVNSDNKVERIMSLENMINGYLMDLEKLQKDLKEQSTMLKDTFENDAEYAAASEKAREVQKMKRRLKTNLSVIRLSHCLMQK
ncbi:hypothetical protein IPM65_01150 [Candidatus Roizmanbacteria bacterium]|nr:MAG: hypothetical protein IPM65_01150 [Candidatus Roizmanbacteria bacterium]